MYKVALLLFSLAEILCRFLSQLILQQRTAKLSQPVFCNQTLPDDKFNPYFIKTATAPNILPKKW